MIHKPIASLYAIIALGFTFALGDNSEPVPLPVVDGGNPPSRANAGKQNTKNPDSQEEKRKKLKKEFDVLSSKGKLTFVPLKKGVKLSEESLRELVGFEIASNLDIKDHVTQTAVMGVLMQAQITQQIVNDGMLAIREAYKTGRQGNSVVINVTESPQVLAQKFKNTLGRGESITVHFLVQNEAENAVYDSRPLTSNLMRQLQRNGFKTYDFSFAQGSSPSSSIHLRTVNDALVREASLENLDSIGTLSSNFLSRYCLVGRVNVDVELGNSAPSFCEAHLDFDVINIASKQSVLSGTLSRKGAGQGNRPEQAVREALKSLADDFLPEFESDLKRAIEDSLGSIEVPVSNLPDDPKERTMFVNNLLKDLSPLASGGIKTTQDGAGRMILTFKSKASPIDVQQLILEKNYKNVF